VDDVWLLCERFSHREAALLDGVSDFLPGVNQNQVELDVIKTDGQYGGIPGASHGGERQGQGCSLLRLR